MIPQPPVTQFTHEEDRNSSDTTSLEAKPAENKPSRGLWLSLCCACTHGQNGEIICTGLNLAMEKKIQNPRLCVLVSSTTSFSGVLCGFSPPWCCFHCHSLSFSHRLSRECLWCWLRGELVLPLMKKSSKPVFLFSPSHIFTSRIQSR